MGLHWFDPFGSVDIKDMVNLPAVDGIAKRRIIFWDQEPLYKHTFSRFMASFLEIYKGPITVVTSELQSQDVAWAMDTYGLDSGYYFFHGWAALDWYRGYNHSFLWQPWNQRSIRRAIFCANNVISGERNHRAQLVSSMNNAGLLSGNFVSFPERCPFSGQAADEICNRLGVQNIPNLPLIIDGGINHAQNSHRIDFWQQATECFCHVVTETVYPSVRQHLTEKTFKPIVLQQPFVLVAPKQSLAYLRHYGFQTFSAIWDETYDDLEDSERIAAITDLLRWINSWTTSQRRNKQHEIDAVVRHNHDWFYGEFQDVLWKELTALLQTWQ